MTDILLPCGGIARSEGYGFRCWTCMAVVGSVAMSKECREALENEGDTEADCMDKYIFEG